MTPLQMVLFTILFGVSSVLCATLGIVLHLLTFGRGDVSMWIARNLWAGPLMRIAGIEVVVEGGDGLRPDRPYIAVANHQGAADIAVLFVALKGLPVRFIAKHMLFYVPIFGWYLWMTGYISVDRTRRRKAFESLDRAADRLRRYRSTIVVFAEGTRSPDGSVRRFKKGAFVLGLRAGAPILPISIAGSFNVVNKHKWQIRPGTVHVRIFDPIETEDLEYADRDALVAQTRDIIVRGVDDLRRRHGITPPAVPAEPADDTVPSAPR